MTFFRKKSWREKLLHANGLPKVVKLTGKAAGQWGRGTMLIPAPVMVDAVMRRVPRGKVITINEIRVALAKQQGTTTCCPLTAGIFAWIAAHAAEEARAAGMENITPYWRTLKANGELNPRYPGGMAAQARELKKEGLRLDPKKRKIPRLADLERRIAVIRLPNPRKTKKGRSR